MELILILIQFLASKTKPDLAFSVDQYSRNVENPTNENIIEVKMILKYLEGTVKSGILFQSNKNKHADLQVEAFCDSNYACSGIEGKLKSTSGYINLCCFGPVRQGVVVQATSEAEYIAAAD